MQTRTPPRPTTTGALLAAAALTLVGCNPSAETPQAGTPPPAPASPGATPSPSTPPPSHPEVPQADAEACYDGECEVEVVADTQYYFDPEIEIFTVAVQGIADGAVEVGVSSTTGEIDFECQSSAADCEGAVDDDAPFSVVPHWAEVSAGPGAGIRFNDFLVEVVDVVDDSATLRFEPV